MSISVLQSSKAIVNGRTASFMGVGGVEPYAYSVVSGGAGGSIDSVTGVYTAPLDLSRDPSKSFDVIEVTDAALELATGRILIGDPLKLFCEIIQTEMGLDEGRVYLWDQKIMQPKDSAIYVAVSILSDRPFASNNRPVAGSGGLTSEQYVNTISTLGVDIMSRGPGARDRRHEILMALGSTYSQQQQEANGFSIGRLPVGSRFVNISQVDGAAIPYRFHIDVNLQYSYRKSSPVAYFDDFDSPETNTNS